MNWFWNFIKNLFSRRNYEIQRSDDSGKDGSADAGPGIGRNTPEGNGQPGPAQGISDRSCSPDIVHGPEKLSEKPKKAIMGSRADKIAEIASRLGIPPAWLDGLIAFESDYDPAAENRISGARGLIQVVDSTARSVFSVADADELVLKYPTFDLQMENIVYPYLQRYAPFYTKQALYMAVFYPKYRDMPADTEFSASVQAQNPGIRTVGDYVAFVDKRVAASKLAKVAVPLAGIVLAALAWYYFRRGGI
jgi:hypothetical protein